MHNKLILTDCDGVLLNWEYAFHTWIEQKGYERKVSDIGLLYDLTHQYDVTKNEMKALIRQFNESAAIGFLPPLRDAIYYVKKLHEEHGYIFHVISSMSLDPSAGKLRTQNLQKLFGDTVFDGFTYLDTGADKHEALEKYNGHGLFFVEDKIENARLAYDYGLKGVLIEHGFNMHVTDLPKFINWKHFYDHLMETEDE